MSPSLDGLGLGPRVATARIEPERTIALLEQLMIWPQTLQYIAILIGQWWLAQNRPLNSMMLGLIVAMTIHLFLVFFGVRSVLTNHQVCLRIWGLSSLYVWVHPEIFRGMGLFENSAKSNNSECFHTLSIQSGGSPVLGWSLNFINYNYRYTYQKPVN